jgi:hypothetical protein
LSGTKLSQVLGLLLLMWKFVNPLGLFGRKSPFPHIWRQELNVCLHQGTWHNPKWPRPFITMVE